MGRYYSGDITGKFWFGVQPSNDASFFGGEEAEPPYLEYSFSSDDLPKIESGIKTCREKLVSYKSKLDKFFKGCHSYDNEMLVKALEVNAAKVSELLEWYARLELGIKIRNCVRKHGSCCFEAEL